jgi:tetratricopeptide (TPR) repeat protein
MSTQTGALAQAYELDRQGRLAEAIERYRRIVAAEPSNSDALQLLGVALARLGRPREAAEALAGAARLQPSNPTIQANLGNALIEIGRQDEAVACFDRALALKPDFLAAAHGRAVAQLRMGAIEAAVQTLKETVRRAPNDPRLHIDLGVALERLDRKEEALQHFERATALEPNSAPGHYNRGLLEALLGRLPQALASLDRTLALQPSLPAIHANRGNVLTDLGRTAEALASYDKALALQPRDPVTLRNRGRLLMGLQRSTEAMANFDAAVALAPADSAVHFHRGVALAVLGRHAEALQSFDSALALSPGSAQILNNRGVALGQLDRPEEAFESFSRAIASDALHLEAHTNAANILKTLNRPAAALEHFTRALALRPADPNLLWGQSLALLTLGEFRRGWPLYESRLKLEYLRPLQRHSELPRWMGEPLEGKTLLVHAEQGLGDTLQFCRYIPLLESQGIRVIFEVQPALAKILQSAPMRASVVAVGAPLPPFDLRSPLLSLPWLLGTELDSIPGGVPYLRADPARAAIWKERLAALPGLKVGLTWQGNLETEKQGGFRGRSFALAAAAPLARVPGVTLISLQKGPGSEQRQHVAFQRDVLELMPPLDMGPEEVMDTAALMTQLDVIVTSDTATAHLAGALGLPVWVLLAGSADWRWLSDRDDSPWYPTMRLFRQRQPGQWAEVFDRVAAELAAREPGAPRHSLS